MIKILGLFFLDLDGNLTEGMGSNIFTVSDGVIYSKSQNVLGGISRETVIDLAVEHGMELVEKRYRGF